MTRIHKRPGTTAWKKSIRKSASRMVRDSIRAERKNKLILGKYLRSKTPEEVKELIEEGVLVGVAKKRADEALRMWREHKRLDEQMRVLVKGGTFNLNMLWINAATGETKDTPKRLKIFRSTTELGISNIRAYIENCRWLEKNLPKKEASYLAKMRKNAQETLEKGQTALKKIGEIIKTWETK